MPDEYDAATLAELGKLALKVANNPKTRRQFLKAVKEVEPDRRFPDQDVEDLREEVRAELDNERQERERERLAERLEAQRQGLLGRFTEEQIQDIEKTVMPKYGISDYEAAAKIYGADLAPALPTHQQSRPGANWELPNFEGLHKDPAKAARDMAYKVIDEMRSPKR